MGDEWETVVGGRGFCFSFTLARTRSHSLALARTRSHLMDEFPRQSRGAAGAIAMVALEVSDRLLKAFPSGNTGT